MVRQMGKKSLVHARFGLHAKVHGLRANAL